MMLFRRLLFILLAALALGGAGVVTAHGYIVRSIPEDRAVLERAPVRVQYWFSEQLEPSFSAITVRDAEGNTVATGGVDPDDSSLLQARLPTTLPDGAYVAELRVAFASDGHVVVESRVFFVGEQVAGVNSTAASSSADPLEVVWRTLVLSSSMLLFGAFTLYGGVLVPAWGNATYKALLPPRVMNRLNWIVGVAMGVALVGSILALLQQTMVFFNTDLARVIEQGLWSVVRIGSRFGDVWSWRMAFLVLVAGLFGAGLYFRRSYPETERAFWTANAWLMALILVTFSAGSHAAGSLLWPWTAIAVDWLHTLAVGFWVGGVAALALVLPAALAPYSDEPRRLALLAALRRFSRLAVACVAVVVATGVYSALNWFRTPGELATTYGGALALKLILVAALLLVGLAHHVALRPARYARCSGLVTRLGGFMPTLRIETLAALAVLASVGLLSATPVPKPEFLNRAAPPLTAVQLLGDTSVSTTVTPGGPGVNSYDVVVTRNGQPVNNLDVRLRVADPSRDWRGTWHKAESAGDGLYVATGDEISSAGDWWMLVDVTDGDARYAFDWSITENAVVIEAISPNALNVLALAGVGLALVFAGYPALNRFYQRLDLSPAAVTVAAASTLATVGIVVATFWAMQASQAQADLVSNPPPQVINTVLPDAASLERGRALLAERCAGWEADAAAFHTLVQRLPRTRDETLFEATRQGWEDLPACGDLTDTQRWDIVNAVRAFENSD
jgi:copper transport protein